MQGGPDDILWISEARMFNLCKLPRSTFQSWVKAGLDIEDAGGAYGLDDVLEIGILVEARPYLGLEELVSAWRWVTRHGKRQHFVAVARQLKEGGRYDLVVAPDHASLTVAQDDAELVEAVRHPRAPRRVVVLDLAEPLLLIKESFERLASSSARPQEKRRGRPRRTAVVEAMPSRSGE